MKQKVVPNGTYQVMREKDFIVSKTDLKGKITYANRVFMEFAKYSEQELLGQPHNIIRHPFMPRAIFKLLWDTIMRGDEIFAYVLNLAKDGSSYWVFANVTPVRDTDGNIAGYYSVRRKPKQSSLDTIIPIYDEMLKEEKKYDSKNQIQASTKLLNNVLEEKGLDYEEYILSV